MSKDVAVTADQIAKLRTKVDPDSDIGDDATLRRFLVATSGDVDKASTLHHECVIWRKQFAVSKIKVVQVYDELNSGKLVFPEITDKQGRPVMILRPRYVNKATTDLLNFMKLVVYVVEKAIKRMGDNVEELAVIVDFSGASLKNVDFRIPRTLLSTIQNNYPGRVGRINIVNPPWFFKYVFSVISKWMDPVLASKIVIGGQADLLQFFTEDNILEELGGKKKFDFREWARVQVEEEKVDVNALIKQKDDKADDNKEEEVDNLLMQAMQDENIEETMDHAARVGYLTKLGGIVKNWKRRYCILKNGILRYYKDEASLKPQGTVILERARLEHAGADVDKEHAFLIVAPLRTWVFYADNADEKKAWMEVLEKQIEFATHGSNAK